MEGKKWADPPTIEKKREKGAIHIGASASKSKLVLLDKSSTLYEVAIAVLELGMPRHLLSQQTTMMGCKHLELAQEDLEQDSTCQRVAWTNLSCSNKLIYSSKASEIYNHEPTCRRQKRAKGPVGAKTKTMESNMLVDCVAQSNVASPSIKSQHEKLPRPVGITHRSCALQSGPGSIGTADLLTGKDTGSGVLDPESVHIRAGAHINHNIDQRTWSVAQNFFHKMEKRFANKQRHVFTEVEEILVSYKNRTRSLDQTFKGIALRLWEHGDLIQDLSFFFPQFKNSIACILQDRDPFPESFPE